MAACTARIPAAIRGCDAIRWYLAAALRVLSLHGQSKKWGPTMADVRHPENQPYQQET